MKQFTLMVNPADFEIASKKWPLIVLLGKLGLKSCAGYEYVVEYAPCVYVCPGQSCMIENWSGI